MNKISTRIKDSVQEHSHFFSPFKIVLTLLFFSLTIYVLSLANYSIISADSYYTGTINVSGHGEIEAKPDVQKLSVDISPDTVVSGNSTSTPKVATSSAEYVKKIVAYLKSKGIPDFDIKTSGAKNIVVKLRGGNMDKAKTMATDIEKISSKRIATTLENPEVENQALLKSRALEMALNDAKMNAIKVSRSLDVNLGKVISFDDSSYNGGGYDNGGFTGAEGYNSGPNMVTSDVTVSFQAR